MKTDDLFKLGMMVLFLIFIAMLENGGGFGGGSGAGWGRSGGSEAMTPHEARRAYYQSLYTKQKSTQPTRSQAYRQRSAYHEQKQADFNDWRRFRQFREQKTGDGEPLVLAQG